MVVNVLYFGMLAEATGLPLESWEVPPAASVRKLREQILDKYPALRDRKFKIAVNQQMVEETLLLPPLAEVALLPPFAGG